MKYRKIYVRVRGGLGNQMFQYAFAYLLSKYSDKSDIILDVREFVDYYWPFELDKFCLPKNYLISHDKLDYDRKIKSYFFYQGIYRKLHHKSPTRLKKNLIKKGYLFCGQCCEMPDVNILPATLYLFGYFQNASFYEPIRSDLCSIFTLAEKTKNVNYYLDKIKPNSVSINIRLARQEELDNGEKYIYSNKNDYARMANEIMKRRQENVQLVISSNNLDKIRKEKWFEGFKDVIYIENCSAIEQLEIMKHCRDFILSNSTFSWWIGYLGSYQKDSIILAPEIWFQNQNIRDVKVKFEGMEIR